MPQGSGRFDLAATPVLYLAEDPEHAVAEKIARFRGATLREEHLIEFHHKLAIVPVDLSADIATKILDLCDPAKQLRLGIRSDQLAVAKRSVTQEISQKVHARGFRGLRWWSSIRGEWHTVVVYLDRLTKKQIKFGEAEFLSLDNSVVQTSARILGMKS